CLSGVQDIPSSNYTVLRRNCVLTYACTAESVCATIRFDVEVVNLDELLNARDRRKYSLRYAAAFADDVGIMSEFSVRYIRCYFVLYVKYFAFTNKNVEFPNVFV